MTRILILTTLLVTMNVHAQNRPIPAGLYDYTFTRNYSTDLGHHYLIAPFKSYDNSQLPPKFLYILDEDGYLAWWSSMQGRTLNFYYQPEVNQYLFSNRQQSNIRHFQMDDNFNLIDTLATQNLSYGDVHEFQIFPNGNKCIFGLEDYTMDLSAYQFGGVQGSASTVVRGAVIQEFDPSGTLVFEWESINHLSVDHFIDTLFNYDSTSFDYVHPNSIELDTDGHLIISLRTSNLVCKINHQTGDVIWKLGGNFSDFTFPNDGGFLAQHDARRMANGNISLYDNQFTINDARGVEYALDTINMTATRVSETNYSFPVSGNAMGSYRVLDNGHKIVGWGNNLRPNPSATLFDDLGAIAANIDLQDSMVTYRAFAQELPNLPPRPTISCEEIGGVLNLSIPDNHLVYNWSSGETTASIQVSQTGEYQVWVDQGIGMLGSFPYEVTDLNQCPNIGLETVALDSPLVVAYFNLIGQPIDSPPTQGFYFVLYSDGSSERAFSSGH